MRREPRVVVTSLAVAGAAELLDGEVDAAGAEDDVREEGRGAAEAVEARVGAQVGLDGVGGLEAELAGEDAGVEDAQAEKGAEGVEDGEVVVDAWAGLARVAGARGRWGGRTGQRGLGG